MVNTVGCMACLQQRHYNSLWHKAGADLGLLAEGGSQSAVVVLLMNRGGGGTTQMSFYLQKGYHKPAANTPVFTLTLVSM